MSEAPKKIWAHRNGRWGKRGPLIQDEKFTQYVRADIVDELVVALSMVERFIKNLRVPQNTFEAGLQVVAGEKVLEKTKVALAKARGETE